MKGSMSTIKRGRDIKARNSSHCKLLKYAKGDEYDLLGWDQNDPGNAQTENRTTSDVYPDNATNDPPPCLPETEVLGDQHQTDDHAWLGLRRSARVRTSTWNTLYREILQS